MSESDLRRIVLRIGGGQAFPVPPGNKYFGRMEGMTYREWLIGTLAQAVVAANASILHDGLSAPVAASSAIDYADAIIARLAAEASPAVEMPDVTVE